MNFEVFKTYQIKDFIMVSSEVFELLLQSYRKHEMSFHYIMVLALMLQCYLLLKQYRSKVARSLLLISMAGTWIAHANIFLHEYLSQVLWVSKYMAWAFYLQAALLISCLLIWRTQRANFNSTTKKLISFILIICAATFPIESILAGKSMPWLIYGTGPSQTAFATILLLCFFKPRWPLLIVTVIPIAIIFFYTLFLYGLFRM